jgi:hypothetical protein
MECSSSCDFFKFQVFGAHPIVDLFDLNEPLAETDDGLCLLHFASFGEPIRHAHFNLMLEFLFGKVWVRV